MSTSPDPSSQPLIRVLLVDDHPTVRAGLRTLMDEAEDLTVVAEAASAGSGVVALRGNEVDVAVVDLRLDDAQGVAAVTLLRRAQSDLRVLVFTAHVGRQLLHDALAAGASGFLPKSADAGVVLDAIRQVARGTLVVDATLVGHLVERPLQGLTERELAVLRAVAEGRTNRQVAALLQVSEDTVKSHLSRAMTKLGAPDRTAAVAIVLRRGLLP